MQRRVGDYAEHRGPVPLEEAPEALGAGYRGQRAADAALAAVPAGASVRRRRLHPSGLEEDLDSLEGGDASLGDGARSASGDQFLG